MIQSSEFAIEQQNQSLASENAQQGQSSELDIEQQEQVEQELLDQTEQSDNQPEEITANDGLNTQYQQYKSLYKPQRGTYLLQSVKDWVRIPRNVLQHV